MKVLHVIPSLALVRGGPSRALASIEIALATQGVVVDTATTDDDGPDGRNGMAGCSINSGVGGHRYYFRKVTEFYTVSPALVLWAFRSIRRYDVVHIHALFSFTSIAASYVARLRGIPYIVRPLGTLAAYGIGQRRPWLKQLSLAFLEGPCLKHAAAVHFTSESERMEAESLGIAMRSVVIPLAVETPPVVSADDFYAHASELRGCEFALYLSRLDPKKNIEGLLRAFALVLLEVPNVRLAIAGSGEAEYVETLKRLAMDMHVQQSVVWLGRIEGTVKTGALRSAKLFVLPSFSENFGIAAAEALAVGLPCVLAAGVALSADIADAGAGQVVTTDPVSIAAALILLLTDEGYRTACGANAARLAVERFSPDIMGGRLAELYRQIICKSE